MITIIAQTPFAFQFIEDNIPEDYTNNYHLRSLTPTFDSSRYVRPIVLVCDGETQDEDAMAEAATIANQIMFLTNLKFDMTPLNRLIEKCRWTDPPVPPHPDDGWI